MHVDPGFGEAAVVGGIVVEGCFVRDPESDDKGDGHSNGEAGDIDGGVAAVFQQVAPGKEKVVFEHEFYFEILL